MGEQVEPVGEEVVPPVLLPRVVEEEVLRSLGHVGIGDRDVGDVRLNVENLLRERGRGCEAGRNISLQ